MIVFTILIVLIYMIYRSKPNNYDLTLHDARKIISQIKRRYLVHRFYFIKPLSVNYITQRLSQNSYGKLNIFIYSLDSPYKCYLNTNYPQFVNKSINDINTLYCSNNVNCNYTSTMKNLFTNTLQNPNGSINNYVLIDSDNNFKLTHSWTEMFSLYDHKYIIGATFN